MQSNKLLFSLFSRYIYVKKKKKQFLITFRKYIIVFVVKINTYNVFNIYYIHNIILHRYLHIVYKYIIYNTVRIIISPLKML